MIPLTLYILRFTNADYAQSKLMKDNYARERINELQKELHEVKWELKHAIWRLEQYLGVEVINTPASSELKKKEKK